MGKISAYKCDNKNCDFITPYKDDVFVIKGEFRNGEDEIIYQNTEHMMLCFDCLMKHLKITSVELQMENQSNSNLELMNDMISKQLEENNIDASEETTTPEITPMPVETTPPQPNESLDSINQEIDTIQEEIAEEDLEEKDDVIVERTTEQPQDETTYDYIHIFKIVNEEQQTAILTQLGFSDLEHFQKHTKMENIIGVYIPAASGGLNEKDLEKPIMQTYNMSVAPILYDISNDIPQIKKASVFLTDDTHSGYISNDILNQLKKKPE